MMRVVGVLLLSVLGLCECTDSGASLDRIQLLVTRNEMDSKVTEEKFNRIESNINHLKINRKFSRNYAETPKDGHSSKRATHTNVAFHVSTNDNRCYSHDAVFLYDTVSLLSGSNSAPTDGVYVVPETGIYVFVWSLIVPEGMTALATHLKLNGFTIGTLISDPDHGTSTVVVPTAARVQRQEMAGSGSHSSVAFVVTQANAGDHVTVATWNASNSNCPTDGNHGVSASFSCWLLF